MPKTTQEDPRSRTMHLRSSLNLWLCRITVDTGTNSFLVPVACRRHRLDQVVLLKTAICSLDRRYVHLTGDKR